MEHGHLGTDVQTAEKSIRQDEQELLLAVDTIPALVWTALPNGSYDFLNRRWLEYAGLTLEEAKGWGWEAAVCPEDLDGLLDVWRALLASGKPGQTEARLRRFDGEYRWFLFRAVPLYNKGGNLVKWYGTTTDLHDRKWAEALLAGENRILEMISKGTALAPILEAVCRLVEEMSGGCLCSMWSTPIFSPEEKVLGTFAIYSREPAPSAKEKESCVQYGHRAPNAAFSPS